MTESFYEIDVMLQKPEYKKELKQYKAKQNDKQTTLKQDNDENFESQAGCTANVVLIIDNEMFIANAGDSRAVIGEGNSFSELSVDHKPDLDIEKSINEENLQIAIDYTNPNQLKKTKSTKKTTTDTFGILMIEGNILLNENKNEEAIACFEKADKLSKDALYSRMALGNAYMQSKRYNDAIRIFENEIVYDPNNSQAFFGLGICHHKLNNYDKAILYHYLFCWCNRHHIQIDYL